MIDTGPVDTFIVGFKWSSGSGDWAVGTNVGAQTRRANMLMMWCWNIFVGDNERTS